MCGSEDSRHSAHPHESFRRKIKLEQMIGTDYSSE